MAYEYEVETLEHATMATQVAVMGLDGWRLAAAVVHPTETQDEQPKVIVFWERELP